MQDRLRHIGKKFWSVVLSPHTVTVFKVAGLALQALHEIEAFRNEHHKGHRMGFRVRKDDGQ